jgi:putative transcriptional regulator
MSRIAKLLIAPPKVKGNFWAKSVIFVTEDHEKGSIGLVLNKPSKMSIKDFSKQHGVDSYVEGVIYVGGPVNVNALTVLHSSEWNCGNTMRVNSDYALSSSADLLARFAIGDMPKKWRMFAGLCAWAPEQLINEIKGQHGYDHSCSWLISSANYSTVFNLDLSEQWTSSIEQSSLEFAQTILA